MHLRPVDYILWLSAPIMQVGVLIAMYRRGIHREFPCFFNYTILQVSSEPILIFFGRQSYTLYYFGYWTNFGLSVLISFAVLQEIFKNAFRPYEALQDLSIILFRWSALVILLVAGMWAITSGHSNQSDAVETTVFLVERSVRLMQCGLVFFLLLFSEYLGISRKSILFGIAIGFGLFASASMLVAAGHASLHVLNLRWAKSAAYDFSCLIWLGYTVLAPVRGSAAAAIQRSKDWNYALEDVRVQPVPDSLLDSMDRTVERLLYPPEEVKASATPVRH